MRETVLTLELQGLCRDRERLIQKLAPLLRYVGPDHPTRAKTNASRAVIRKRLKRELKANSELICAEVMDLYTRESAP